MSSITLPPASIPPSSLHTPTDLHTACQEFESLFLALLLRQMQATVPRSAILPSSAGRRLFDSLWLQEISRTAARSSPLGIADLLEARLAGRLSDTPNPNPKPMLKNPTPPAEDITGAPQSDLGGRGGGRNDEDHQ